MNSQELIKLLAEEAGLTVRLYSTSPWIKISCKLAQSSYHMRITGYILEYYHITLPRYNQRIDLHDPDSIRKIRTYFKYLSSELLEWDKRIEKEDA